MMSPTVLEVYGDCPKCGRDRIASHDSWDPKHFHLDFQGNVLGQLELEFDYAPSRT